MSGISEKPPVLASSTSSHRFIRCLRASAFVGIWMATGWLFHLDPNSYLLVGVPLVAVFQIFVCKKPLVGLWVRDATRFRLDIRGVLLALVFAVLPAVELVQTFKSSAWSADLPEKLWLVCCLGGAFCAAFSLRQFTRETWKSLWLCLATAGLIGCGIMVGTALLQKHSVIPTLEQFRAGLSSLALYFPISFILEEVAFRGALDSQVHQPGDQHAWLSAIFISALWGLWHLPIVGVTGVVELVALILVLPCMHIATGVFLSFGWRRSGNLAVPALAHALIDAVRNMLLT